MHQLRSAFGFDPNLPSKIAELRVELIRRSLNTVIRSPVYRALNVGEHIRVLKGRRQIGKKPIALCFFFIQQRQQLGL